MKQPTLILSLNLVEKRPDELIGFLLAHVCSGEGLLKVFTPNAEQVVQAARDPGFFALLKQAEILLPDGMGLVWGYNSLLRAANPDEAQGKKTVSRIAGVDVVKSLLERLPKDSKQDKTEMLLIGGQDYNPEDLPQRLSWIEGFEDITSPQREEERLIKETVIKLRPQIVFVAFGAPHQEKWIADNQDWLQNEGVKIAMAVGGSFDTLTGKLSRAPVWMRKLGLEWLFRLIQEPWRWRRQLRLITFMGLMLRERGLIKNRI